MLAMRVLIDWFFDQPFVYKLLLLLPVAVAALQVVRDAI